MIYTPDTWVKLRFTSKQYGTIDKILAGWYGGYANGDSWKINSGILSTKVFKDRFEFTGHSGSVYVCYKNRRQFQGITANIYAQLKEQVAAVGASVKIIGAKK